SAGPIVTITSSSTIGCTPGVLYLGYGPQSITLTANAQGAASYLWSTGATTASIAVTTAGIYNVTVWDSAGCSSTPLLPYTTKIVDVRCGNRLQNVTICHVP